MRKLTLILATMVLLVSLCGCSGATDKGPEPGTALSTFYQAVLDMQPADAEALIMFEEFNPDLIWIFQRVYTTLLHDLHV